MAQASSSRGKRQTKNTKNNDIGRAASGRNSRPMRQPERSARSEHYDEPARGSKAVKWGIAILLIIGAIILAYVAIMPQEPGTAGYSMRRLMSGLCGGMSIAIPLFMIWVSVVLIRDVRGTPRYQRFAAARIAADGALFPVFLTMVQLFYVYEISETQIEYVRTYPNFILCAYGSGMGGGALGSLLAWPLYMSVGEWGGFLLMLIAAILLLTVTDRLSRVWAFAAQVANRLMEKRTEGRGAADPEETEEAEGWYTGRRGSPKVEPEEEPVPKRARSRRKTIPDPISEPEPEESFERVAGVPKSKPRPQTDVVRAGKGRRVLPHLDPDAEEEPIPDVEAYEPGENGLDPTAATGAGKRRERKSERNLRPSADTEQLVREDHGRRRRRPEPKVDPLYDIASDEDITEQLLREGRVHDRVSASDRPERPSRPAASPADRTSKRAKCVQPIHREEYPIPEEPPVEEPPMEEPPMVQPPIDVIEEDPWNIEPSEPATITDPIDDEDAPLWDEEPIEPTPVRPEPSVRERRPVTEKPSPRKLTRPVPRPEPEEETTAYNYPPIDLLEAGSESDEEFGASDAEKAEALIETLKDFGIETKLTGIAHGPAVTRFELLPRPGIKVGRIASLADDIAMRLAAMTVRIEAPIPGKSAVGVEVPNDSVESVHLYDVLMSAEAQRNQSRIAVALGKDNSGHYVIADIAKMPHVLIAGQTGSGKSVCINSIICSILFRATPDEVKLILIDPKVVELSIYNDIPHLVCPVVTDPKKASGALAWAVSEMSTRYKLFADRGVRDIKGYNKVLAPGEKPMPQMVIIIDELADLMMACPGEVEDSIQRLAQLARACGMHLVIATQRPSVNVITGVIKANIPSRIAFSVASQIDSRTMIDHAGAEKLLGNGDMLYVPAGGIAKAHRVQGTWISDDEVHAVVSYIKARSETAYDQDMIERMDNAVKSDVEKEEAKSEYDPLLPEAVEIVVTAGQASVSMLQRKMRVGYARAGRLIDEMEQRGIVSPNSGAKPREVLITRDQLDSLFEDDPDMASGE